MPILIGVIVVLAVLFAPWLLVIVAGIWAAYWVLVVAVAVSVGLALVAYAGYMFFVVYPRQDRLTMEKQQARNARMRARDNEMAAQQRAQLAAFSKVDEAKRRAKAEENAIQAEVDEQIREAKIRKELKAGRAR